MTPPIPPSLTETEAYDAYRRLERVYQELRAAHNHLRSNLSRLVLTEQGTEATLSGEIGHFVKRIEDVCFQYRLAARTFAETAAPHIESVPAAPRNERAFAVSELS